MPPNPQQRARESLAAVVKSLSLLIQYFVLFFAIIVISSFCLEYFLSLAIYI